MRKEKKNDNRISELQQEIKEKSMKIDEKNKNLK